MLPQKQTCGAGGVSALQENTLAGLNTESYAVVRSSESLHTVQQMPQDHDMVSQANQSGNEWRIK
jgi:hypothetical protein